MWKKYEKVILDNFVNTLDGKNLAITTHRFSHAKQGSLEFWTAMNEVFVKFFNQEHILYNDCMQVIHSFSLMNILAEAKFLDFSNQIFQK